MRTTKEKLYQYLPVSIKDLLLASDGWLVGGSIQNLLDDTQVKDYDIIIPEDKLTLIFSTIRGNFQEFNTFGGYKLNLPTGESVDIWVSSLDSFIKVSTKFSYAYNLRNSILIKQED